METAPLPKLLGFFAVHEFLGLPRTHDDLRFIELGLWNSFFIDRVVIVVTDVTCDRQLDEKVSQFIKLREASIDPNQGAGIKHIQGLSEVSESRVRA